MSKVASGPDRLALSAGALSVAVASVLAGMKLWALVMTGSLAVGASLADSALDLVMSLGALAAIIYAAKPEDDDHLFGHHAAEDLAVLAQTLVILASAALIGFLSLRRLLGAGAGLRSETEGMVVMAISMALTLGLVLWQGHVAKRTGNRVVAADRLHYLGDLLPAMGAIIALELSRRFGWGKVDAVIGLVAAAVMAIAALRNARPAWDALMDRTADADTIARVAEITAGWPGVRGWHDLLTRRSGSRIFIHLHIELDGEQSLREAHDIGAGLRAEILRQIPGAYVIIHKDVANPLTVRDR